MLRSTVAELAIIRRTYAAHILAEAGVRSAPLERAFGRRPGIVATEDTPCCGGVMRRVADIVVVAISLEVCSEDVLFILLANDGAINRMGTGQLHNTERNLHIGRTNQPLLQDLLTCLTDEMLRYTGAYDVKDKRGDPCRLSIVMKFIDGSEDGFIITYGSESEGPPREIRAFVEAAAQITEPWYSEQKAIAASRTISAGEGL